MYQERGSKLYSTLSKLKYTFRRSKLYNEERVYLKICTFHGKPQKNNAKSPIEVLTTQSSKKNRTENTDLKCLIPHLSACTKQWEYTKDPLVL